MVSRGPLQVLRESHRTRRLLTLVLASGGLYFGVRALAAKLLVALLYHPFRYEDDPGYSRSVKQFRGVLAQRSYQLEKVEYSLGGQNGSSKLDQRAFLLQPKDPPVSDLWLVFGGNAMVGADWFDFILVVLSMIPGGSTDRPAFLLMDYPGYGANAGTPSVGSILLGQLQGLQAALPRLRTFPGKLHLLGHSIGAAAASQLAANLQREASRQDDQKSECKANPMSALMPGRLVLSAPFLNIDSMAQVLFGKLLLPSWLLRILLTERWDNSAWVPQAAQAGWDVSIILGYHDEIVPTWMGKSLRDAVRGRGFKCNFVEIKKAGHNDIINVATRQYAVLMGLVPAADGREAAL